MRLYRVALLAHPPQNESTMSMFTPIRVVVLVAALVSSLTVGIQRADAATATGQAATGQAGAGYRITHPVRADHLDNVYWSDTWGAPRSGGRSHIGVDIMGPKMTPLVAANDSVVTWGEFDNAGGNIVRIRDGDGWEYQYIHVNNDTPGTDDGQASCRQAFAAKICDSLDGRRIKRGLEFKAGEFIAYLGDSGNAEWTGSHLHFEVFQPTEDGGVVAVNPTPYFDAALTAGPDGDVSLPEGSPWPDVATAVSEIYEAIEDRPPSSGEAETLSRALQDEGVGAALAEIVATNNSAAMIDRLYLIFFRRYPEIKGYNYWMQRRGDGESLEDIAEWFAESDEFQRRYGRGDFEDFLNLLYRDVLFRGADEDGNRYWLDRLERGDVTRGTIVVYFSEGSEATRLYKLRTERTVLERILTGDRPTEDEINKWAAIRADTDLATAIGQLIR